MSYFLSDNTPAATSSWDLFVTAGYPAPSPNSFTGLTVVGSETATGASQFLTGNWVTITLSTPISLSASTRYGATVQNSTGQLGSTRFELATQASPYVPGYAFAINPTTHATGDGFGSFGTFDLAFVAHLTAVPEPSSFAMLLFGGVGLWLRKRKRAA